MNDLFEKFVAQLLRKYLPPEYKVIAGKRITQAIILDGSSYRYIIPDILVENKRSKDIKVFDVKYKNYGKKRVDNSDIYQLAFYAQNQLEKQIGTYGASIIYPSYLDDTEIANRRIALNVQSGYPGTLDLHSIRIEAILDAFRNKRILELREEAIKLIQ
jgi:5-methylcytosine-specific restriction enzyme subunit McrC